jgi:hypothetical protein
MRIALGILGLVLFAAGAGAGYLFAVHQVRPPTADGQSPANTQEANAPAAATGLYSDAEVAAMRGKLPQVSLPTSRDTAFALLGIDPARIGNMPHASGGQMGNDVQTQVFWRLSSSFGISLCSEHGPHFGPRPTDNRDITRIVIARVIPDPGNPENFVAIDEHDPDKSEVARPRPGPNSQWKDWKYPNLTETFSSMNDPADISGGFAGKTTDDFDKVLDFYYQKCHVARGAMQEARAPFKPPEGDKVDFLMFRGYDNQRAGPALQARFLNLKLPAYTVSILVVRGQNQKETQIFVNLW